ncbi:MAG: hypothetical protein KME19_00870 [Microcoleus vaginatus WJT46-NPBG5]|nr:hypothetical protein [Microcoleus vaginatus WJT46-NPBG5]
MSIELAAAFKPAFPNIFDNASWVPPAGNGRTHDEPGEPFNLQPIHWQSVRPSLQV